jgi:hypothetical protein
MACATVKQGVVGALVGAILTAFAPAEVAAVEPIKIGAVLPFSGGVELYGEQGRLDHHATLNMFLAKTQTSRLSAHVSSERATPVALGKHERNWSCALL